MSGITVNAAVNGLYEVDSSGGGMAYKQQGAGDEKWFLYRLPSPASCWMFGPALGEENGWIYSTEDNGTPFGLNWMETDCENSCAQKAEITVSKVAG